MTGSLINAMAVDRALRDRADHVIPGGMYGHQTTALLPSELPQFLARGDGARVWDVDGHEYLDLMCSYGPIVLGHQHPAVEAAVDAQRRLGDCLNTPTPRIVELAEVFVDRIPHADWALFSKNGTDATTLCLTIARNATGRRKILVAERAYHGAAPWCSPDTSGVLDSDRAHLLRYRFNEIESVEAAVAGANGDLAGILVSAFRHDISEDQEMPEPAFARRLREICDAQGAALILDDVRGGMRLHPGGSWEPLGVRPDLSAWSKAIANGYALAAVLGVESLREAAAGAFNTGSFWFAGVSMAASLATIETLRTEDGFETMRRVGQALREGLAEQATSHELEILQTGPVQMPWLRFADDADFSKAVRWTGTAAREGVYLHPRHNWFMSAALTDADISQALEATDRAFAVVRAEFGPS